MLDALNHLVLWLWKVYRKCSTTNEALDQVIIERLSGVLQKICSSDFLLGILCLARIDNEAPLQEIHESQWKSATPNANKEIEDYFHKLAELKVEMLSLQHVAEFVPDSTCFVLQPLLAVELQQNPSTNGRLIAELLTFQKLKRYSRSRLYAELIRACLLSVHSNDSGTSRESLWCAFTFIRLPQILKQLTAMTANAEIMETDSNSDVLEAVDSLMEETALIDMMDYKFSLNTIEYLLKEFAKQSLVTEQHVKHYAAKREAITSALQALNTHSQSTSIVKYVIRAEQPLSGILKTLNTDYNKVQEALLSLLFQVLLGNSFELILSVATVEGKLKTFVNRLINCNECSKQVPGEVGKTAATRAALFDVTFLILTFIVQTYGSETVLDENGDSFFETWVRSSMMERNKWVSSVSLAENCDPVKVDELIQFICATPQPTTTTLKWHEICEALPSMLYQVALVGDSGSSPTGWKSVLDSLKTKMCSYSVCAAAWLCAHSWAVSEDEQTTPMNMLQHLVTPVSADETSQQAENFKERLGLTFQIIRKMQHNYQPPNSKRKTRILSLTTEYTGDDKMPDEKFKELWSVIIEKGHLPVDVAHSFEQLAQCSRSDWLVQRLAEEILNCKYIREINKVTDLVFAIMHLDIESLTVALVADFIPRVLDNTTVMIQPHSTAVARLCVFAMLSSIVVADVDSSSKKRDRLDEDEAAEEPQTKSRKVDGELGTELSGKESSPNTAVGTAAQIKVKEPLLAAIKRLFTMFAHFVSTDVYSPNTHFAFEVMMLLVETGNEDALPILRLIPAGFIQNLLKVMPLTNITPGFILRLYDLSAATGRQNAISDLSLLRRNIQLNCESLKL